MNADLPVLSGGLIYLKRPWRWSTWAAHAHTTVSVHHAWPAVMRLQLIHLGLLLRCKSLKECSVSLGVYRHHLPHHGADAVGDLLDGSRVIFLHSCLQVLVRSAHLIMECFSVISSFSKNRGGLLLLLRGQGQMFGEKAHLVLDHLRRIRWIAAMLRHGTHAGQGKK